MAAQSNALKYASFEGIAAKISEGKVSKRFSLGKQFQGVLKNASFAKLEIKKEPMISSVVYGIQLSMYQSLKKKARIIIPNSATLIGVVDSEGILEEDEVFVQIRRDSFKCRSANEK
jgi:hypothetical protein